MCNFVYALCVCIFNTCIYLKNFFFFFCVYEIQVTSDCSLRNVTVLLVKGGSIPSKEEAPKVKRPYYGKKKPQKDQQRGE